MTIEQTKLTFLILGSPYTPPYNYSKHFLLAKTLAMKGVKTYYYQPHKVDLNQIIPLSMNFYLMTIATSYISAKNLGIKSQLQNVYDDFKIFIDTRPNEKIIVTYFESDEYYDDLIEELKKYNIRRILSIKKEVPFLVSAHDLKKLIQDKQQSNDIKCNKTICSFMAEYYTLNSINESILENLIIKIEQYYQKTILFYIYANKIFHINWTDDKLKTYPALDYDNRIKMINYTDFIIIPEKVLLDSSILNLMFTALWHGKKVFNISSNWNSIEYRISEKDNLIKLFEELGGINLYNININPAIEITNNILDGFESNYKGKFAEKLKKYEVNNLVNELLLISYQIEESNND